ncbi:MAG: M20/M25/M40 family metallo-hydrolase [Acidimicrobiia bacterium]|nr:M20/M25/M40 family metallo-hydrolase [Acidimicrobiia bacterium]
MGDLLELTAELVDIPSPSFEEAPLVDDLTRRLSTVDGLELTRVGDNLVARTDLGRDRRVVLAGHTDTVPATGDERARVEGDVLWGVGSADMKGGLAVMVELARTFTTPAVDVTYVFYAREEVASRHSGLLELVEHDARSARRATWRSSASPPAAAVEAGCQGTMRLRGASCAALAPTPPDPGWVATRSTGWVGSWPTSMRTSRVSRCSRAAGTARRSRRCSSRVAWRATWSPTTPRLVINHRFAPDRSAEEAEAPRARAARPHLDDGDDVEVVELLPAAVPAVDHPLIASLVDAGGLEVRAKLGWTDVARFAGHGVPAVNFGPGDSRLAHTPDEHLGRPPSIEAAVRGRSWRCSPLDETRRPSGAVA